MQLITRKSRHCALGTALPAAPVSLQYHGCRASGIALRILDASGISATPYRLMASQSPCVIPSFEWIMMACMPGSLRTRQQTQCRYRLHANRLPRFQKWATFHSMRYWFDSLKPLWASNKAEPKPVQKPFYEFKTVNSCWWLDAKSPIVDIHEWILPHSLMTGFTKRGNPPPHLFPHESEPPPHLLPQEQMHVKWRGGNITSWGPVGNFGNTC